MDERVSRSIRTVTIMVGGFISGLSAGYLWGSSKMHKKMAKPRKNGNGKAKNGNGG